MSNELRTREIVLDRAQVDEAKRTVAASLSSETPVRRGGEVEVLRHSPDAIDLTRADGGLPLLFSHDRTAPIGVVEGVRINAGRLVGQLRFGQSAKATEVWNDVREGVLRHVSITYSVDATEAIDGGYAVTRWSVYEASVVSVPADPSVGIGRSAHEPTPPQGANSMPQNQNRDAENTEIRTLAKRHGLPDAFADDMVARSLTVDAAKAHVLDELVRRDQASGGHRNVSGFGQPGRNGAGEPGGIEQREQIIEALASRMGGPAAKPGNQYVHASVPEIARECLEVRGVRTTGMSRSELIQRSIGGVHTTSDFANLLTSSGERTLRQSFSSYAGGVKRICKPSTATDFRAKQRLTLGEAPALLKVNEHGEFKSGTMAEMKSSYALSTFGRIFGISRQALINDDLDAFGELSVKYGRAAAEFESSFLVTLLTSNPVMTSDGVALFHATHGNLQTGAGSALQLTSLSIARLAMRLQKGLDGVTPIDATAKYLVVPAALETTAEQLLTVLMATQISNVNPFGGKLELVVDPRLDAASATAWYLAADANALDTLEYAYLDSANGPEVIPDVGFEIDGMQWKVRLDFGAGVLDWRGLYKSNGA